MSKLRTFFLILAVPVVAVAAGGCGGGSHDSSSHGSTGGAAPAEGARTVDVTMRDISYSPASVPVKAGETVKFVFHNEGQIPHDAFLGDEAAQNDHEMKMRSEGSGGMGGGHGDENSITVAPGQTGSLTHTFKSGESLVIGCHQPGHYTAGMKVALTLG